MLVSDFIRSLRAKRSAVEESLAVLSSAKIVRGVSAPLDMPEERWRETRLL